MKKGKLIVLMLLVLPALLFASTQFDVGISQSKSATSLRLGARVSSFEFAVEGGFPFVRHLWTPGNVYEDGRISTDKMSVEDIMKTPMGSFSILYRFIEETFERISVVWAMGLSTDVAFRSDAGGIKGVGSYGPTFKVSMLFGKNRNLELVWQGVVPMSNLIGFTKRQDLENWKYWTIGNIDRTTDEYTDLKDLAWYTNMKLMAVWHY